MKSTGTFNIRSGNWNKGLMIHVSRNFKHDKNPNINLKYSGYNRIFRYRNPTNAIEKRYRPALDKQNHKYQQQGKQRRIKTWKQWSKNKTFGINFTLTFGSENSHSKLIQESLIKKYYGRKYGHKALVKRYAKALNYGFKKFNREYNKRNPLVPMTIAVTNTLDEATPHEHGNCICLGRTKRGKPSKALSRALEQEMHINDYHKAMALWRKREDAKFVATMGSVLSERFTKVPEFKKWSLHRTHKPTNQSEVQYKRTQAQNQIDEERRQLRDQRNKLNQKEAKREKHVKAEKARENQHEALIQKYRDLETKYNNSERNNTALKQQNTKISKERSRYKKLYHSFKSRFHRLKGHFYQLVLKAVGNIEAKNSIFASGLKRILGSSAEPKPTHESASSTSISSASSSSISLASASRSSSSSVSSVSVSSSSSSSASSVSVSSSSSSASSSHAVSNEATMNAFEMAERSQASTSSKSSDFHLSSEASRLGVSPRYLIQQRQNKSLKNKSLAIRREHQSEAQSQLQSGYSIRPNGHF